VFVLFFLFKRHSSELAGWSSVGAQDRQLGNCWKHDGKRRASHLLGFGRVARVCKEQHSCAAADSFAFVGDVALSPRAVLSENTSRLSEEVSMGRSLEADVSPHCLCRKGILGSKKFVSVFVIVVGCFAGRVVQEAGGSGARAGVLHDIQSVHHIRRHVSSIR
jgi:hypothetical protein